MREKGWVFGALGGSIAAAGAALVLANCGGQTAGEHGSDGGPSGADGTVGGEGSPGVEGGADSSFEDVSTGCGFGPCDTGTASLGCPPSPPAAGGSCTAPQTCEYGSSWFLECNLAMRCVSSAGTGAGQWMMEFDGGGCPWLEAGPACPATFAEAMAADAGIGTCPFASCVYPEGWCGCGVQCGGGGGVPAPRDIVGFWSCIPTQPGCPEPRPLSGTACDGGSPSCNYGFACGCGQIQQCFQGTWSAEPGPACP